MREREQKCKLNDFSGSTQPNLRPLFKKLLLSSTISNIFNGLILNQPIDFVALWILQFKTSTYLSLFYYGFS